MYQFRISQTNIHYGNDPLRNRMESANPECRTGFPQGLDTRKSNVKLTRILYSL